MEKEKQIEEMAKTILDVDRSYYGMECDEIQAKAEATAIYDKGYRKASEVAREIFEAFRYDMRSLIEASKDLYNKSEDDYYEGKKDAFFTAILHLDELIKKKYTEGEKGDV